jgi:hypothetical protein
LLLRWFQDRGQDLIVPPWEEWREAPRFSTEFARLQQQGESQEFRQNVAAAAAESYRQALEVARSGWERCSARLWLGRSYQKAGMTGEAERTDHQALQECGDVRDADGVPLALYAAERLLTKDQNDRPAADYVLRRASAPPWRPPNEALLLESLLRRMPRSVAADLKIGPYERALEGEIRNGRQIATLVQDPHDPLGKLQQASRSAPGDLAWVGYGDEPWLLTLVSPTSFATPLSWLCRHGRSSLLTSHFAWLPLTARCRSATGSSICTPSGRSHASKNRPPCLECRMAR